jgi:hypothetical protein
MVLVVDVLVVVVVKVVVVDVLVVEVLVVLVVEVVVPSTVVVVEVVEVDVVVLVEVEVVVDEVEVVVLVEVEVVVVVEVEVVEVVVPSEYILKVASDAKDMSIHSPPALQSQSTVLVKGTSFLVTTVSTPHSKASVTFMLPPALAITLLSFIRKRT